MQHLVSPNKPGAGSSSSAVIDVDCEKKKEISGLSTPIEVKTEKSTDSQKVHVKVEKGIKPIPESSFEIDLAALEAAEEAYYSSKSVSPQKKKSRLFETRKSSQGVEEWRLPQLQRNFFQEHLSRS